MSNFPNIWRYYAVVQARDQGLALCVMLAMIVLGLLINVRARWPDAGPRFMRAFVVAYYVSLVGMLAFEFIKG